MGWTRRSSVRFCTAAQSEAWFVSGLGGLGALAVVEGFRAIPPGQPARTPAHLIHSGSVAGQNGSVRWFSMRARAGTLRAAARARSGAVEASGGTGGRGAL